MIALKSWPLVAALSGLLMFGLVGCPGGEEPTPVPPSATPEVFDPPPTSALPPAPTVAPPTPTLLPDTYLVVNLESANQEAVAGEEWRVDFTIINRTLAPAFDVVLDLKAVGEGKVVAAHMTRGDCVVATCRVSSLDENESVSGHLVAIPALAFERMIKVDADISWELSGSRRGHSSGEAAAELAGGGQPGGLMWLTPTEGRGNSCGERTQVGQDAVFVPFARKLYAVSRDSGEVLWVVETDGGLSDPYLAEGNIYLKTGHREPSGEEREFIWSLNAKTGELNWEREVDGYIRGPGAFNDDTIFYTANVPETADSPSYSYLLALEASTGIMNWRYRLGKDINTAAVEYDGNIYFGTVGSGPHFLYAIDAISGKLNRKYDSDGGAYYTPLVAAGSAFTSSGSQSLSALNLSEGREEWNYRTDGWPSGTPAMSDGNVYIAIWDDDKRDLFSVNALDAETGKLEWSYQPGEPVTLPTAANGSVYVPSETKLASLEAQTGSLIWEGKYSYLCTPPTVVDGVLYGSARIDTDNVIYAIRGE